MRGIALLAMALLSTSCRRVDEARWSEEVMLHDGRIVQVQRRATRASSDFPNPGRGTLGENELAYEPMGVRWHNAPRSPDWLLSFDIFDGTPYLAIRGAGWEYCRDHGPESYDLTLLKWVDGKWERIPEAQFPLEKVTQNISMRYWGQTQEKDARGGMTWQMKIDKDYYGRGGPEPLVDWVTRRRQKCGQTLPHLFKDK